LAGRLRAGLAFSKDGKTAPQSDPLRNARSLKELRKAIIESMRTGA
jgi:hypothetical protein